MALIMMHQDQQPEGIVGTQVAWELILQGGSAIQNRGFTEGLCVNARTIVGRKVGFSKPPLHALAIGKR